jgi:signal transduction histidine kinase
MHSEAQHLNHLIEDLRTLSLADAGELTLTPRLIDPNMLLERTASAYTVQAQERGISLMVENSYTLPMIEADEERLVQVLENLVTNAMRFTSEGGEILLSATSDAQNVFLLVKDTGTGITPEDLPFIFERSFRGDKARQQNAESGLGLAIAKSLVEMHHGSLTVESTLGEGTIFTIELPILE